jgi:hypothetical protein
MFLAAEKAPHKTPQIARIPPQTHHTFTTTKRQKNVKTPRKITGLSSPNIFSKNKPRP